MLPICKIKETLIRGCLVDIDLFQELVLVEGILLSPNLDNTISRPLDQKTDKTFLGSNYQLTGTVLLIVPYA